MIEYKELVPDHFDQYKRLILRGFIEDEESFRIAPEDIIETDLPTGYTADSFTIGAFSNDDLVGVASFKRDGENRLKLQHKGLLFRILVAKEHRKKGIASRLIEEIILRVKKVEGIEQINLTVVPSNEHAKKLYEKFGFETYASEPKAIKWKGRYFSEDQMKLML